MEAKWLSQNTGPYIHLPKRPRTGNRNEWNSIRRNQNWITIEDIPVPAASEVRGNERMITQLIIYIGGAL